MMKQPDFICIGAQKAATTWLASNLGRHPGVWLPFVKEIHFFDAENDASRLHWRQRHARYIARKLAKARQKNLPRRIAYLEGLQGEDFILTDEWYGKVFANCPEGCITGEFTPRYATLRDAAIDKLLATAPNARFIYLIRDPVERAMSQFRMRVGRTLEDEPNTEEIEKITRDWVANRRYDSSDYAFHIPRWEAKAGRERILFLPFGEVRHAPFEILGKVEQFLGLTPFTGYPKAEKKVHSTKRIEPPAWLRPHLEADLAPHMAFLKERFPAEFVAALR